MNISVAFRLQIQWAFLILLLPLPPPPTKGGLSEDICTYFIVFIFPFIKEITMYGMKCTLYFNDNQIHFVLINKRYKQIMCYMWKTLFVDLFGLHLHIY